MAMFVARYSPTLLAPLMSLVASAIRRNVYRYVEDMMNGRAAADRGVFSDPLCRENFAEGLRVGFKSAEHLACELVLAVKGWEPAKLSPGMPVDFIHGEDDSHIEVAGARRLVAQIEGARLHVIPQGGHFLIYSHWREILQAVRAAANGREISWT